jgi:hypothetical protein
MEAPLLASMDGVETSGASGRWSLQCTGKLSIGKLSKFNVVLSVDILSVLAILCGILVLTAPNLMYQISNIKFTAVSLIHVSLSSSIGIHIV